MPRRLFELENPALSIDGRTGRLGKEACGENQIRLPGRRWRYGILINEIVAVRYDIESALTYEINKFFPFFEISWRDN